MKPFHADQHPTGVARSVSRRLAKAGFQRGSYGRYCTFGPPDGDCEGFIVHRLGYSRTVTFHWHIPGMDRPRHEHNAVRIKMMQAFMQHRLEQQGYVVEKNCKITCGKYSW